jgi:2-succinyl-5-enolpyruvyl-6-hydroxy-3-cyclohexene-1-carboxylate synthase
VVALLGDPTCQHDLGGLALTQGMNAIIIAINNSGGGIFDLLPQAALPEFKQGWRTPQRINFEHAALSFGLSYAHTTNADSFRQALRHSLMIGRPHLIESIVS